MSYDSMVFNSLKAPNVLGQMRQYLSTHMENDVLPDEAPAIFSTFLERIRDITKLLLLGVGFYREPFTVFSK